MAEKMGKYSITMPTDVAEAAREYAGPAGLSAFVTEAVESKVRHLRLGEFLAEYEEEHGAFTEEEIERADREIAAAHEEMLRLRAARTDAARGEE